MLISQLLLAASSVTAVPAAASSVAPTGDPDVSFGQAVTSTTESPHTVSVTVTLSQTATSDVTIPYTVGGSADGADASVAASPLIIATGQSGGTIDVQIFDDVDSEGVERVTLTLGNPTNGNLGAIIEHEVVILDDEPAATISFDQFGKLVTEAEGTVAIPLTLSAPRTEEATFEFVQSGTASTTGADVTFAPVSPVTIPAGTTSIDIDATIVQDLLHESSEDAVLTLTAPDNCVVGTNVFYTLTITDDDGPPAVRFQTASSSVVENGATTQIAVELTEASGLDVTVPITVGGTATDGVDFTWTPSSLVILAGDTTGTVDVTPMDDAATEGTETAIFTLGSPTNATNGSPSSHTLSIIDDDAPVPTVDFALALSSFDESAGTVLVDVVLSGNAPSEVTIPVDVAGTASGADATVTNDPLVVPAGASGGQLMVAIDPDTMHENDETVVLTFGAITGGGIAGTTTQVHTLTIQDDDPEPAVAFSLFRTVVPEASGTFNVRLELDAVSGVEATVPFTVTGSASGPGDVTLPPSPATIPAGSQFVDLPVTLVVDRFPEPGERMTWQIGAPTGATVGTPATLLVLVEDGNSTPVVAPFALTPSTTDLVFPTVRVGESAPMQSVFFTNDYTGPVVMQEIRTFGSSKSDYLISYPVPPPIVLQPGQSGQVDITFAPTTHGRRDLEIRAPRQGPGPGPIPVSLTGIALGATGADILMTADEVPYQTPGRGSWSAEYGGTGGTLAESGASVNGTSLDGLYQSFRIGPQIDYSLELPVGTYEVRAHTWEPFHASPGQREMDVVAEGVVIHDDVDIFIEAGANTAYVTPPVLVDVLDGTLDLSFVGVTSQALVSALEIRSVPILSTSTSALDFGTVDQGATDTLDVVFQNDGLHTAVIDQVTFRIGSVGDSSDFSVQFGGSTYQGGTTTVVRATSIPLGPGQTLVPVAFTPTEHADHSFSIDFESLTTGDLFTVDVSGTGGAEAGWGFLHPVLDTDPPFIVDYDGSGSETIGILGGESHTHEPGHALVGWDWEVNGTPVASGVNATHTFPVGSSTLTLTITDNNTPPDTASDDRTVTVHPVDGVPGPLALYYDGSVLGEVFLLDNVPTRHEFAERLTNQFSIDGSTGTVGQSPFTEEVMVQWLAEFDLGAPRTLEFIASGGVDRRTIVNGSPAAGPLALGVGTHTLDIRFAVSSLGDLPISLSILESGSPANDVMASLVHDEQSLAPVIHSMPSVGTDLGGNRIDITGFGFFPEASTVVHWGTTDFTSAQFDEWSGERITLTTPPGMGTIQVTVETPQGVSEPFPFSYSPSGPVPVRFQVLNAQQANIADVTCAVWGPDERLYVAVLDGSLRVITYDDDWNIQSIDTKTGVSGLTNRDTLGLVFNPWDVYDPLDPSTLKLYIAHGEQFQNGGGSFTGPSYFTGQVSILSGPDFDNPQPLITQLPVSNHDHAINGMVFDANGDLIFCSGGNTNAGVIHPQIGDLPESPLSGAILRARLSKPGFNGTILYEDSATSVLVDDQVFGHQIDVAPGVDVEVYSPGHRNPFDLVLHSNGLIYATDNGPNTGFGRASLTLTTDEGPIHPYEQDEVNLVEPFLYYGHPNRSRGRYDPKENTYRRPQTPTQAELFVKPLTIVDSSTNGIDEYRATAFNSAMRGELISMKWNFGIWRLKLSPDGRTITQKTLYDNPNNSAFPQNVGLDVLVAPGGAIIAVHYLGGKVTVQVPDDVAAIGPTPYDITPHRAVPQGGQPFVIGGVNFGNNANVVSVTVGGVPATITSVSPKRIRGIMPASPTGGASGPLPVAVTVNGTQVVMPAAMQFLASTPGLATGTWRPGSVLPLALGEVSAAALGDHIYVIGQGDTRTFRYNVLPNNWTFNGIAQRPFAGNHHGLEVHDGKIYLLGGLEAGSAGRVQIFDPVANSWSLGAPMPWNGGSCSTALIDGLMYVCGGNLQNAGTAGNLAVYDPVADSWTPLGVMPTPVNHAASATDGERLFVFGGRQGPNVPAPGFTDVQIYDPVSNTWETSANGDVAPMPLGRGGTGRAVYFGGEFYVMGGEDTTQAFDDVQVYNPTTDTWRMDAPMPTARHGIYPVNFMSRIFVFGGGLNAGFGFSAVSEVLSPR